MKKNGYFESHIDVLVSPQQLKHLRKIAKKHQAVISHSIRKVFPDGSKKMILTIRSYQGFYEEIKEKSRRLHQILGEKGFCPEADLIEFAIYDTNFTHDESWIKKE